MIETVQDLIVSVLRLLGVLPQGETPNASEAQAVFDALNEMLDHWNTDRTNLYTVKDSLYNLTVGKGTYQIGPGAQDFNQERPALIQTANIINSLGESDSLDLDDATQWAAKTERTMQASRPKSLYYDYGFPIATLNLHPVPKNTNTQMELFYWLILSQFGSLQDTISLPPGYLKAVKYNLAVNIAPEFPTGVPMDPRIPQIAASSKAAIQQFNARLTAGAINPQDRLGVVPAQGLPLPAPPPQAQQ